MKVALKVDLPSDIVSHIATDTPAGKDAARLLTLCLATDIEIDAYKGWEIVVEYPEDIWCQDDSNILTPDEREFEILYNPGSQLLEKRDIQIQKRQDEVVCILHAVLAPYGIVAITAKTWGCIIFGQLGRERIVERERVQQNIEFKIHLDQMNRLDLKSPLN